MRFDDFLREHGRALWRVVASYAPPGAERDDLAQDILVAVWQALSRFREGSSLRSYVLRIAHNRGRSHAWRRAKLARAAPEPIDVADPRPGPDEQAETQERAERFLRHLRTLPLGLREVLALAFDEQSCLACAQVAGSTGGRGKRACSVQCRCSNPKRCSGTGICYTDTP